MRRIIPSDKEWPGHLGMLEVPPSQLFIESSESDFFNLTAKSIAIVGSRNATPYGLRVAADFAADTGYVLSNSALALSGLLVRARAGLMVAF